jgi:amino acid adenylation domain-containing protein
MQKTVSQGFRLSPRQQHLWWALSAVPDGRLVVQARIEIAGPLHLPRLARAVERAVERHEILRTTFPLLPALSVPVQSIAASAAVDWSAWSLGDTDLDWLCADLREIPFDLANGPLLRATLVQIEPDRHAFVLTQSAFAADAASLDLLIEEIAAAYHGRTLPGEVLQYADLAELLHDWQSVPAEEPGPAFWRRQDLSTLARATLPQGRPGRPERASRRIARDSIAEAAERLGTTVSTVLLAAWQGTLQLSTGEEEIVVGTLFDGRTCEELETALGPFAHCLPVRAQATVNSHLDELCRSLSSTLAEISRRQDFFSAEPVEKLLAEHGLVGWPFGFDYRQPRELSTEAPIFTIADGALEIDRFGVRLSIFDQGEEGWSLRAALYAGGEAERLLERFSRVLDGLLAGLPLGEIDPLTEDERRQVLAVNRTESPVPDSLCAHHLVEERARLAPQAPALVHAGRTWTYADLDAGAERVARRLRAAGLGPGALVGLCMERSPALVEALLGVLKAGAAYVPLDPDAPAERRAWMAEDAGLALVLTEAPHPPTPSPIPSHPPGEGEKSGDGSRGEARVEAPLSRWAGGDGRGDGGEGPDDLAYVLYTSGSTGHPKGVMVSHRALVNYLLWARQEYAAGEGAGAPVHSTLAFDLTVTSLLVPLSAGTAVTLLDASRDRPVAELAAALRGSPDFSLVKLTPAHLDVLRGDLGPADFAGAARSLVIGGEALRAESLAPWREQAPQTRLINEYGPTEATVGCCIHEIEPDDPWTGPVPIGRPIANTHLYVVGQRWQPVSFGAPGELWIGGDGLARGYLRRPGLTAERFVPDPFSGRPGERLYRTGDLVRMRDNRLEFLGRIDHQIKLRGFRIEPGEIEMTLAAHGGVREAAVLADEEPAQGKILVACIVGEAGDGELRRHLLERLPEPMVPSRFAFYEALPLTANGKVDRRELARTWREKVAEVETASGDAPRSWTEELLAGMFAELLGRPRVGREESFFALGGHSLLAAQAVSRIREAFGVEMTLRAFFDAPTVALLAGTVDALRAQGEAPAAPPLVRREGSEQVPASFAQQRLWLIDRLAPGSPLYNIPLALRVEGPLDLQVLAQCLGEIVRRHEALRTVFPEQEGEPVQSVLPAAPFELPLVDLAGLPESRREAQALALVGDEAARPFDLARGPLFRGLLLRLAGDEHIAALTLHHIAGDGWSIGILVRELAALYPVFAAGRPSPLPELPVQYADFSVWQRSWLHGETLEREIDFWRRQLAGLPPRLTLPTDRPRPAVQSFLGATRRFHLPAEVAQTAVALSRREGATLFLVLLAAFQALLARHSGQQDLAVGSPVAGRTRVETEGLIGFFVNTLVLRAELTEELSFRRLLAQVRDTALAAQAHQDVPFERLIQELAPERSLAQTPLFQVMFMLQNAPADTLAIKDLHLRPLDSAGATAKFDLNLSLGEQNNGLSGTAEYATDLFDAATIDRWTRHYERLLATALAAPDEEIFALPLLSSAETHHALWEWNDTVAVYGEPPLLHELFEGWAARTPDAVAVVGHGGSLTYGAVAAQAEELARRLAARGIGPGSLVGVHLRRTPALVPALLAVLKAGAAYVPLEIGHPPARLRWILGALEISCVLTESGQLAAVKELAAPALEHVLCVDRAEESSAPIVGIRPMGPTPDSLAYVIFTSGSTGTPKGVIVRHRPVVNLIRWAHETFAFSPADRVLCVASLAFDLSVFDLFGLLAAGGSIRIAAEDEIRDPQALLRALAEEPITFWNSAPAALEQTVPFLTQMSLSARPALRLVFLSGDWVPVTLPDRLRSRFPGARVIALGGATEATVWSNLFPVERVDPAWTSIPYGRPIANARYHVLDHRLAPCPVGVAGDLFIGGDCLADGYAREPELTAQKFLPDPWGEPGGRLYRTGDRARYRPDGNLEFLGRRDTQVKIRGFRIELGEIEAALAGLSGVREAVVTVREERLIAYVTGEPAGGEDLRRMLRERLPEPMIPSGFVHLATLPLTANGKVDRKALPAPQQTAAESYVAPRTPVEEALAGIWADLLGLPTERKIGADDDFFALGGHSLLATRLLAAVRDAFGVELPLRLVFEQPTVAGLARAIAEAGEADDPIPAVPRAPGENRFPVSFQQLREWILHRLDPETAAYNIPSPLRIEGPLAVPVLIAALRGLVHRHEIFRTRLAAGDGDLEPFQIVQPEARLEVPVLDLSALPAGRRESELQRRMQEEAAAPFDLAVAPLLRARMVRLAPVDHALLLTVHHAAADGWSLGILHREVAAFYDAGGQGLRPLPVQYGDYAAWQRRRLEGERLEQQATYWRQQLAGAPPLLELSTDRPRPPVRNRRGGKVEIHLPPPLSERLAGLARRRGATLFMVLLAGYQTLLGRWSGQDDIAVGTYSGSRPRRELEGLIGFFINTLVLRSGLAEGSFTALLDRVRETVLGAFAHGDLPFEKLLEILGLPRDPSRTPLFQALLVLQNFPPTQSSLRSGIRLSSMAVGGAVEYDVELWLGEGPDGIAGTLQYNAGLFDAATMARFAEQLRVLLEGAAADPEQSFRTLPLIAGEEQALQLRTWSRGPAVPAGETLLHRLVEEQAARTPTAVALEAGDLRLTYAELVDRARRLKVAGVGPGSIVALPAERTPELIVSMLAVLQAGAAYLPIDPAYPPERQAFLLEDSGAVPLSSTPEEEAADRTDLALDAEEAAYVLYTSGSTGLPKGVVVPHRAIASFVRSARETYALGAGDRVLQFASLSFDTSAEEIWPALAAGATLVLRPEDMAASIPHFLSELARLRITVLDLPTAFWHELAAWLDTDEGAEATLPPALRLVILGGEEALADRFAAWKRRAGASVRLVNTYGPTEATIVATRRELSDVAPGERVPIGRPIPGARAYGLDRFFAPVPPGVRGELWLGGAGLSRGYLGRPALTAERFVPDPFAGPAEPGARLYRTGDLAVLRPDGDLVFAGRADRQLKVRGYRIEPGEIEAALRRHPLLHDAAVDLRGAADDRRLVAWVVARPGAEVPGSAELRAFLRDRLPEPMLPADFAPVPALPLTPTGKVDRRALPEPARLRPETEYQEPGTALERAVAAIFRDLLRIDRVGLHDNFFDLGGHSLLVIRAHQKLRAAAGREIPVVDLFRFPTVALLARHLSRTAGGQEEKPSFQKAQDLAARQRAAQLRQKQLRTRR